MLLKITLKKAIFTAFIVLIILIFPASGALAAIYYVDALYGNDANSGLSPATPWKTIAKVSGRTYSAGDQILFCRGGVWREQLTVTSSGATGNPILYGAYGTGGNPVINAADPVAGWTSETTSQPSVGISATATTPTPVALWYFEEASGSRYDSSANHNDLSAINSVSSSSDHKQGSYAVKLDKAKQYLTRTYATLSASYPLKQSPTTAFTLGTWVNFWAPWAEGDTVYSHISAKGGLIISVAGNTLNAKTYNGGAWVGISADDPLTTNTWYHLALRWDSATGELAMFINGVKQQETMIIQDFPEANRDLVIGKLWGNKGYANVLLDEFFAFDQALPDSQINEIYLNGLGTPISPPPPLAGPIYYVALTYEPKQVLQDGKRLTKVSSKDALSTSGTWWWDATNFKLYVRCTDDADPNTHVMEASRRSHCIYMNSKSQVTVENLKLINAAVVGMRGDTNCSYITVQDCYVAYARDEGINAWTANATNMDHWLVRRNEVAYCGSMGITGSNYATNWLVENNDVHHNCALENINWTGGIRFINKSCYNVVIQNNRCYSNGLGSADERGYGIWIDTVGNGFVIRYNECYSNNRSGIMVEDSDNAQVSYNLCYGNRSCGIWVSRSCAGNKVDNNTLYNNGIGIRVTGDYPPLTNNMVNNIIVNNIAVANTTSQLVTGGGGENDGTYGYGNVYEHNCFGPEAAAFIFWGWGVPKNTYSAWETAYGAPTASVKAGPQFVDSTNANFRLQPTSPCINMALGVGLSQDYYGTPVPQGAGPDVGAAEYLP